MAIESEQKDKTIFTPTYSVDPVTYLSNLNQSESGTEFPPFPSATKVKEDHSEGYLEFQLRGGVVSNSDLLGYEETFQGILNDELSPRTIRELGEMGYGDVRLDEIRDGSAFLDPSNFITPQQKDLYLRATEEIQAARFPVRRSDVVNSLSERNHKYLAMDMFLNVDGAYRDIDEVFKEDGTVNYEQFNYALEKTFQQAYIAGPAGFANTAEFLDILMGNRELTPGQLEELFAEREKQLAGTGRSIAYLDPVGLAAIAKEAFGAVTGRTATKAEQQAFIQSVHGLQSSGQQSIDVQARAEQQARSSAPIAAGAMDYVNSAGSLMKVLGLG
jgi:hypothetical protein